MHCTACRFTMCTTCHFNTAVGPRSILDTVRSGFILMSDIPTAVIRALPTHCPVEGCGLEFHPSVATDGLCSGCGNPIANLPTLSPPSAQLPLEKFGLWNPFTVSAWGPTAIEALIALRRAALLGGLGSLDVPLPRNGFSRFPFPGMPAGGMWEASKLQAAAAGVRWDPQWDEMGHKRKMQTYRKELNETWKAREAFMANYSRWHILFPSFQDREAPYWNVSQEADWTNRHDIPDVLFIN